jgi:flagellar biosynthesis protein FlhB
VTLFMAGPAAVHDVVFRLSVLLSRAHELDEITALRLAASAWLHGATPFASAALLAGSAAVLLQTRFLLSARSLRVDLSRVSPRAGLRRLLGADNLLEAGKSLLKVAVLGAALWRIVQADLPGLLRLPFVNPSELLTSAVPPVLHILLAVLVAQAAIAAMDFFWVVLRHSQSLRMSRHDIVEEQKETEGDPRIKARLRQIRVFRARKRMLAAVPKATVVITNPTHYAVALAYDRAKHAAPRVVAKGVDTLAARIREVAVENRVPVVSNPPLARALYRVEVDTEIPAAHYQAVAEIIAYVWRLGRPRSVPSSPLGAERGGGVRTISPG